MFKMYENVKDKKCNSDVHTYGKVLIPKNVLKRSQNIFFFNIQWFLTRYKIFFVCVNLTYIYLPVQKKHPNIIDLAPSPIT